MTDVYKMKLAGLERALRLCPINEKIDIAAFIMFSDVEITVESAKLLLERAPEFDVILTAESKGIPLAYEMARQSGKPYVVARKSVKLYMRDVVSVTVQSITTAGEQVLYLDGEKAAMLKGKRVLLADDVISTGESLNALEKLTAVAGGEIVGKTAVLAETDSHLDRNFLYCGTADRFFAELAVLAHPSWRNGSDSVASDHVEEIGSQICMYQHAVISDGVLCLLGV